MYPISTPIHTNHHTILPPISTLISQGINHLSPPLPNLTNLRIYHRLNSLLRCITSDLSVIDRLTHTILYNAPPNSLHPTIDWPEFIPHLPPISLSNTNLTQQPSLITALLANQEIPTQDQQMAPSPLKHSLGNAIISMTQYLTLTQAGVGTDLLPDVRLCIHTETELNQYRHFIAIWQHPPAIYEINGSISLAGQSLEGFNLSHLDLQGRNLSNTNLTHANLSHANLIDANLDHADLSSAQLFHTQMTPAQLNQCQDYNNAVIHIDDCIRLLQNPDVQVDITQLRVVILTNKELDQLLGWPITPKVESLSDSVLLDNRRYTCFDMSFINHPEFKCSNSRFEVCDFDDATLNEGMFNTVELNQTEMNRTKLTHTQFLGSHFNNVSMEYADLSHGVLFNCRLITVQLTGSTLHHTTIMGGVYENVDLSHTDLSMSIIEHTTMTGVTMRQSSLLGATIDPTLLKGISCEGSMVDIKTLNQWGLGYDEAYHMGLCMVIGTLSDWHCYQQMGDLKPRLLEVKQEIIDECIQTMDVSRPLDWATYQWGAVKRGESWVTTYQVTIPEEGVPSLIQHCADIESGKWIDPISQESIHGLRHVELVYVMTKMNWAHARVYEKTGIIEWLSRQDLDPFRNPIIPEDCVPLKGVLWSLCQQYPDRFNPDHYPRLSQLVLNVG